MPRLEGWLFVGRGALQVGIWLFKKNTPSPFLSHQIYHFLPIQSPPAFSLSFAKVNPDSHSLDHLGQNLH